MHSQNNNGRIKEALKLIDRNLTWVSADKWPLEGWRPYKNYELADPDFLNEIISCQHGFGKQAVRLGVYFDWHLLKPVTTKGHLCVYLGDVERLVNEFKDKMEEYEDGRGRFR